MDTLTYRTLIPLFDELRGARVLVRPYRESDAQALFEAIAESRDHLRPWMPFADAHQAIEETRDWIIHKVADWLLREVRSFEIGYWLRASAEGHGYMTEAVHLLTDYAFTSLAAQRLEIRCDERNTRSAAIPRRLGFIQEARLRNDTLVTDGQLRTTLIFALIPTDRGVQQP